MKSGRDDASVKPQDLEQSYSKPKNISLSWVKDSLSPQKYDGSSLAITTTLSKAEQDSKCLKNDDQTSYANQIGDLSPLLESPNEYQKFEKQKPIRQRLSHNAVEDGPLSPNDS